MSYQFVSSNGQLGIDFSRAASRPNPNSCVHLARRVRIERQDRRHASLPAMMVRYEGPLAHPVGINGQPSDLDDGTYHGAFQDFYFGTRFKLLQSARFALTPFVEVIVPSHHYESLAQTAVGRDLRALVVGAAAGGFAEDLLPGLYFQTGSRMPTFKRPLTSVRIALD